MAHAPSIPAVSPFEAVGSNLSANWEKWKESFEFYIEAVGLTADARKRALLLHSGGPELQSIFKTFTFPVEEVAEGTRPTYTQVAAVKGISQVIISRITMASPGMLLLPVIMDRLEKYPWMKRVTFLHGPFQVFMVGCFLVFMVPTACSLFPQQCSLRVSTLKSWEPDRYEILEKELGPVEAQKIKYVYFNKGL